MIGPRLTGTTGRMLGVGFELGAVIAGLTVVGYLADGKFGTTPYLALVGALLGTGVGSYNAYRAMERLNRRKTAATRRPRPDHPTSDDREHPEPHHRDGSEGP